MNNDLLNLPQDFTLKTIFQILWKGKLVIIVFSFLVCLSSVIVSINLPNKYVSSATFQVIDDKSTDVLSSAMNQFSNIPGIGGMSFGGNEPKINLVIEKLQSKDFVKHLISFDGVLEKIIAAEDFDYKNKKIIYDEKIFDSNTKKWVRSSPYFRSVIPSYIEVHESKEFNDNYEVTHNKKNNFITVSFKHYSPNFAYDFINLVINEMDDINRKKDLLEAESSLIYLKNMLEKTNEKEIKDLIARLLESNLKVQMLANVNENYLINVVDSPFLPEMKTEPRRSIIVIISTLLSIIISSVFVLSTSRDIKY